MPVQINAFSEAKKNSNKIWYQSLRKMWKLIEKNMHNDLRQNMVSCSGNDLIKKNLPSMWCPHPGAIHGVIRGQENLSRKKTWFTQICSAGKKRYEEIVKKTTNPALTILSPKLVTMTGVALGCAKATWYILEMVSFILEFSNAGGLSRWLGSF